MSVIPYVENPPWNDGAGGGTSIDAADLNKIEQGITDAHLQPAVRVYNSANIAVTNATDTALTFDTERYDRVGGAASTQHSTSTNTGRLTAIYAGIYSISGCVRFAANGTGIRLLRIRLNGTTIIEVDGRAPVSAGDPTDCSISTDYELAVNDYVELLAYQSSGGSLNALAASNHSPEFRMHRVA